MSARPVVLTLLVPLLGLGALAACSAESAATDGDLPGSDGALGSGGQAGVNPGSGGAFGSGSSTGSGGTPLPPEVEEVGTFRPPVVSGGFLWSANPESGRVALIDAVTLGTRVVSAGLGPTYLAGIPSSADAPAAIVINTGNSTATLLRASESTIATQELPIHPGADSWSVAKSGDFAVAFSRGSGTLDPTQGLQDITLIDLRQDDPELERLTAGYRPSQVVFDELEETLIVVSEQGISTFELDGDAEFFVPLSGDALDVTVTEDGLHALVHAEGSDTIDIVALTPDGDGVSLTLAGAVTDLDLSVSGRAVAVVRDRFEFVVFDVEALLADPTDFRSKIVADELFGSVELSPDGEAAVLFTTTGESDRLTIVDTTADELETRSVSTETPIASVRTSPDGLHAIALGQASAGAMTGAFTLVALTDQRFPRIVGTKAPVMDAVLDDSAGVVTTKSDAGVYEVYVVAVPSLNVEPIRLASPPVSAGVLSAEGLGFVSQVHPSGRVSFFDLLATETRTLTGFELSAEVVDE